MISKYPSGYLKTRAKKWPPCADATYPPNELSQKEPGQVGADPSGCAAGLNGAAVSSPGLAHQSTS